jgi:pimeloyl-ACP methyl ester carboxylesterase
MREIPFGGNPALAFGNPAFLLDEQRNLSIPSAYSPHADGLVPLQLFHSQDTFNDTLADVPRSSARSSVQHVVSHQLSLSYPEVQWEYIRASAGWASSQWQGLVVSDLVIEPDGNASTRATYAFVLDRTAQFAVIPEESWDRASTEANGHLDAEWHNGDWYSYNGAAYQLSSNSEHGASSHETPQTNPQRFLLPHLLRLQPGRYKLLLRVMYETRAFGEPRLQSPEGVPIITVKIDIGRVHTLSNTPSVEILAEGPVAVVPSVVGGWIAGWGFSIPLRNSGEGTVVVRDVRVKGMPGLIVKPSMQLEEARIGSLQTRPIALRVEQSSALAPDVEELDISFSIVSTEPHAHPTRIDATIKLDHRPAFQDASECPPSELCDYLITYLSPFGTVDFAAVIPPKLPSDVINGKAEPPMILGLHGAGVDAADRVWPQAFNRQNHSWIILPSGGTGWGYDWQLRSHDTASAALIAQAKNVYGAPPGSKDGWKGDAARVLVVGHSNGGQGAAYFMSRDPDRVIGGVVAAGYIKVSDYVPFTWHEGRHYLDHRLAGILHSSLTMFENDLHASNLAGIPLLWKYGSRDEDVPPHHSPTMSGLVEQWNARLGFQMGTSR